MGNMRKPYIKLSRKILALLLIYLLISTIGQADLIKREMKNEYLSSLNKIGKTLFVGGIGSGNFSTINDAIDAANDNDTIYVYSGNYYECLRIRKSITLIGENKVSTIINASFFQSDVISIFSDSVIINGFTITNDLTYGWGISIQSKDYITISNNIICEDIRITHSTGTTITDNIFTARYSGGIRASQLRNCTIAKNHFSGENRLCIYQHSIGNFIVNNVFEHNGIYFSESFHNTVVGNTINGTAIYYLENQTNQIINHPCGQLILINCSNFIIQDMIQKDVLGITLCNTHHSLINNITISQCESGISLEDSSYNMIENCRISKNTRGLSLERSQENIIKENHFEDIDSPGITILESQRNIISHNIIKESIIGINLVSFFTFLTNIADGPFDSLFTYGNCIKNNEIIANEQYGIYVEYDCICNDFLSNNFRNNSCHASFSHLYVPMHNRWRGNYWDNHEKRTPKMITGSLTSMYDTNNHRYVFHWYVFDMFPNKTPNDSPIS